MSQNLKPTKAYQNFLFVKKEVVKSLQNSKSKPSNYWQEELKGFEYMMEASPLIINSLRHHCYHLTGIYEYRYRSHHVSDSKRFYTKYQQLRKLDKNNFFIPESPLLGGFGHTIENKLINIDTLKFYECLIALDKFGALENFKKEETSIVIEIGAGWGGFAYQFKKLFQNTTYLIVDFPQTFLFSATYLMTLFPKAKILIITSQKQLDNLKDTAKYDFVFIPNFLWDKLKTNPIKLLINMVSFQEMTSQQVDQYIKKTKDLKIPLIYSLNRERSPHNNQLTTVSSILRKYYELSELRLLDLDYSQLPTLEESNHLGVIRKLLKKLRGLQKSIFNYRHFLGRIKNV